MDIRKNLKATLKEYGHTVTYIRTNQRFRCSCFSERNGEATNVTCPICYGSGFKATVERVLTRRKLLTASQSLIASRSTTDVGNLQVVGYTYYMEFDTAPKSGDFIFEVIWDNGVPIEVKEKLLISAVDAKYGLRGRTEFFQVYARTYWSKEGDTSGIDED